MKALPRARRHSDRLRVDGETAFVSLWLFCGLNPDAVRRSIHAPLESKGTSARDELPSPIDQRLAHSRRAPS